jgi:Glycosyltransferase Family 4
MSNEINQKKILIVCKSFYPEITPRSFRATELAKGFVEKGHKVTVLTQQREEKEYAHLKYRDKIKIKYFGKLNYPEIKINYKNKLLQYTARGFRRLLNLIFEYPDIEMMFKVKKALKTEMDYDLLISIAVPYPVHWGVAWANTKKHRIATKWVADCGDPYIGDKTDSFRKLWYFSYIEKWFMNKANFISIPIKSAKDGYYPEYHHKIKIIPQGFDFNEVQSIMYIKNDRPTFAYAGCFIPNKRDPANFIKYLSTVKTDLNFIIYSEQHSFLHKYKDQLGEKLEIRNYIPRTDLLNELSKMDFLVNFDNNTRSQSPSKLIDYCLVNRPILNVTNEFDANIMMEFLEGNYSNQLVIENIEQYNILNVTNQFLNLFNE